MSFEARERRKIRTMFLRSVVLANKDKKQTMFLQCVIKPNRHNKEVIRKLKESFKIGEKAWLQ